MLFESFVAEWLKANAPVNLIVDAQYSSKLNANAERKYRIDIVLRQRETNRVIGILDTKYKTADTPEMSDIEQAHTYAHDMGTDKARECVCDSRRSCVRRHHPARRRH